MNKVDMGRLLSSRRLRDSSTQLDSNDGRNPFDNDFSRVVLSSYVRRLQDKAQVFPLEKNDFVRTRLTHSLEVSCFSRGLGLGVEKELLKTNKIDEKKKGYIPSILQTAGLIHDIGNPPFGHFGEVAISRFFKNLDDALKGGQGKTYEGREVLGPILEGYTAEISNKAVEEFGKFDDSQKSDFLHFDGNVQGFRILAKLGLSKDEYSFNLCCATLAAVIKYPCDSVSGNKKDNDDISLKKFGYFQSEKDVFLEIFKELGLPEGQRHPLVFLLEAADDIAYSVSDLEDGYKLGCITIKEIQDIYDALCVEGEEKETYEENSGKSKDLFVQSVRIKAQSKMLRDCTQAFIEKYDEILEGRFKAELISASDSKTLRDKCKGLGGKNFEDKRVLRRELVGDKVITYFLNLFIGAILSDESKVKGTRSYKIIKLIPEHYMGKASDQALNNAPERTYYQEFMAVVDFISGMTDSYALTLYQELTGQIIS